LSFIDLFCPQPAAPSGWYIAQKENRRRCRLAGTPPPSVASGECGRTRRFEDTEWRAERWGERIHRRFAWVIPFPLSLFSFSLFQGHLLNTFFAFGFASVKLSKVQWWNYQTSFQKNLTKLLRYSNFINFIKLNILFSL